MVFRNAKGMTGAVFLLPIKYQPNVCTTCTECDDAASILRPLIFICNPSVGAVFRAYLCPDSAPMLEFTNLAIYFEKQSAFTVASRNKAIGVRLKRSDLTSSTACHACFATDLLPSASNAVTNAKWRCSISWG